MTGYEPDPVGRAARDRRDMDRLAERICRSIGEHPRALPSRTTLALERVAGRVSVAATTLAIVMLTVGILVRRTPPHSEPALAERVLEGTPLRSQDVYAAMTGIAVASEARR